MPKVKTKRAAAKRFKVTGTGKISRHKSNTQHILGKTVKISTMKPENCVITLRHGPWHGQRSLCFPRSFRLG